MESSSSTAVQSIFGIFCIPEFYFSMIPDHVTMAQVAPEEVGASTEDEAQPLHLLHH